MKKELTPEIKQKILGNNGFSFFAGATQRTDDLRKILQGEKKLLYGEIIYWKDTLKYVQSVLETKENQKYQRSGDGFSILSPEEMVMVPLNSQFSDLIDRSFGIEANQQQDERSCNF